MNRFGWMPKALRALLLTAGLAVFGAAAASAQVENEKVTRDDLTKYVYQAMEAQRPDRDITEIQAVYMDGELTRYRVTYSGSGDGTVEFEPDGHVVGRTPPSPLDNAD